MHNKQVDTLCVLVFLVSVTATTLIVISDTIHDLWFIDNATDNTTLCITEL